MNAVVLARSTESLRVRVKRYLARCLACSDKSNVEAVRKEALKLWTSKQKDLNIAPLLKEANRETQRGL